MVVLIHLARNTALSRQVSTAICASNGSNNCTHNEDFSAKGANLLLTYFKPHHTKVDVEEKGTKIVEVPIKHNITVRRDDDAFKRLYSNLSEDFMREVNIFSNRCGFHLDADTNKEKLRQTLKYFEVLNNHSHYILGYLFGYLDFDKNCNIRKITYKDYKKCFIDNGKGKIVESTNKDRIKKGNVFKEAKDYNEISNESPKDFIDEWQDLSSGMTTRDYMSRNSFTPCATHETLLKAINVPQVTIKKEEKIIEEKITKIPGKLVFNPKKDVNGNYIPSDDKEGVMHRLNALQKNNIQITSKDKTLIFQPENIVSTISKTDNNNVEHLVNGAVIEISDTKRGIGKKSKKICLNVLGTTKVIQGDQTCEF